LTAKNLGLGYKIVRQFIKKHLPMKDTLRHSFLFLSPSEYRWTWTVHSWNVPHV